MKHKIDFRRLGRKASHRKALHRNMVTSLLQYERIKTSNMKAKEIRRSAEKMITRAKVDSVHNRRIIAKSIRSKSVIAKLFLDVAPRFFSRPGGYTRIIKLGRRNGDGSEVVLLELVERKEIERKQKPKKEEASGEETEKEDTKE